VSLQRPNLNALSPADRAELANLILGYINDDLLEAHLTWHQRARGNATIHFGEFFGFHRRMIGSLENFLSANGGERFTPLPYWDPDEPIPSEFFYAVKPSDDGTERPPLENPGPIAQVPNYFIPPGVCSFKTEPELAAAFMQFHDFIHTNVRGAMATADVSPAAAIFWPWHAFVDLIAANWEQCG
jgi:hypothetical protein